MIRVGLNGACGRTARLVARGVLEAQDLQLVVGIEAPDHPLAGSDIGKALGGDPLGAMVYGADSLGAALDATSPDVMVDYSVPDAGPGLVEQCTRRNIPLVIATTGYTPEQMEKMLSLIASSGVGAVISANFTPTGNLALRLGQLASRALWSKGYDVEIIDFHDRLKPDAPSGTALMIGKAIADALDLDIDTNGKFGRERGKHPVPRPKEQIGFHSVRAGGPGAYLSEHQILVSGPWERIIITSEVFGMESVVGPTLDALRFAVMEAKPGHVYGSLDVMGMGE